MQPKLLLLEPEMIARILDEAYQLLLKPGIKVNNDEARDLLASAGAQVDLETNVVHIPEQIVRKALESTPREFYLYDYDGNPKVKYGGDAVHFDPGRPRDHVPITGSSTSYIAGAGFTNSDRLAIFNCVTRLNRFAFATARIFAEVRLRQADHSPRRSPSYMCRRPFTWQTPFILRDQQDLA